MQRSRISDKTQEIVAYKLLQERFLDLWNRCLLPGSKSHAAGIWPSLAARYSESHRHYHGLNHLVHCLEQFDLAKDLINEPNEVEMAILFHDVINDPGNRNNEKESADYFRAGADGQLDPQLIDHVADMILATTHCTSPSTDDQRFLCDIDLASFGCPWECYLRDSLDIEAEFNGTKEEFEHGKVAFLQSLLKRPRIFLTDFFNQRYEAQGRENITRMLGMVGQENS